MINVTKRLLGNTIEWVATSSDERGRYVWRARVVGNFATIKADDDYFALAVAAVGILKSLDADTSLRDAYEKLVNLH